MFYLCVFEREITYLYVFCISCYRYTLLVGKPPFETSSLQDTYLLIKKNEYHIPSTRVSSHAKALIQRLLKADPTSRPSMTDVLKDPFFTAGDVHLCGCWLAVLLGHCVWLYRV